MGAHSVCVCGSGGDRWVGWGVACVWRGVGELKVRSADHLLPPRLEGEMVGGRLIAAKISARSVCVVAAGGWVNGRGV